VIQREQRTDNTMLFSIDYSKKKELSLLALTDVHYDSKICNRKLLKKHLDLAVKKDGYIFFNGDWFDVMGSKGDPRSKPKDIRPEYYAHGSYLDLVIEDSYEFLKPYKDRILFMGYGNHETAMMSHHDTDPIRRLVSMLDANILTSKYYGVARFRFHHKGTIVRNKYLVHHHGFGGNAKRSKGVLNVDLNSQRFPFADVFYSGHIHQMWDVTTTIETINANDKLNTKNQIHLCGGTYQGLLDKPLTMGWPVEKGMNPSVTGSWFINFKVNGYNQVQITTEKNI